MAPRLKLFTLFAFFHLLTPYPSMQYDCSRNEYDRCVQMADPLIKEVDLIFPDNMDDIDQVCRSWNSFVDCLKRYTDRCFTDQQRRQFNKAVENPIESIHQMCTQADYQQEYLQHAPCMKNTIIQRQHCGPHYNLLVEQVEQGDVVSKATLCCSHDRFKQCVLRETKRMCDRGLHGGPASRFSEQIVDKALSFLQDQCFNYIPNSGDCMTVSPDSYADPLGIPSSPTATFPWSKIHRAEGKEIEPQLPSTSIVWLPSSESIPSTPAGSKPEIPSTPLLGSRSRPSSYGRSSSWAENPATSKTFPAIQAGPVRSQSPSTSSARPDWATESSWNPLHQSPLGRGNNPSLSPGNTLVQTSSETWYPAAGSQLSNEVDEPNQQGLHKSHNSGKNKENKVMFSLTVVAILAAIC